MGFLLTAGGSADRVPIIDPCDGMPRGNLEIVVIIPVAVEQITDQINPALYFDKVLPIPLGLCPQALGRTLLRCFRDLDEQNALLMGLQAEGGEESVHDVSGVLLAILSGIVLEAAIQA